MLVNIAKENKVRQVLTISRECVGIIEFEKIDGALTLSFRPKYTSLPEYVYKLTCEESAAIGDITRRIGK